MKHLFLISISVLIIFNSCKDNSKSKTNIISTETEDELIGVFSTTKSLKPEIEILKENGLYYLKDLTAKTPERIPLSVITEKESESFFGSSYKEYVEGGLQGETLFAIFKVKKGALRKSKLGNSTFETGYFMMLSIFKGDVYKL